MKRALRSALVGACLLTLSGAANADQTYHTERLDLWLTDAGEAAVHPDLRSGHVINIHANGPVNGALERYMINGAKPNTEYQVVIEGSFGTACKAEPDVTVPTAVLTSNAQGKANGKAHFSRADIKPFSGKTLGVRWTLVTDENVVAYETECTVVSVD